MKNLAAVALAFIASNGAMASNDYPYVMVPITNVTVTGGFWLPRIETNRIVTVKVDFKKSEETGRISNFELAGKRAKGGFRGIPFDDSDVYKIVEGAAYTLATHSDPELEKYLDNLISNMAKAQEDDGYLYTARTLGYTIPMTGPKRWSNIREGHELYNIGHMYEAAVAYYYVTGKRTLLDVAIKSADLVDRTFGFGANQIKAPPGHEEIELALCKLYRATGEERYLKLAKTLLDLRGRKDVRGTWGAALQDHLPVVEQKEAYGHAVRAGYLYCGMADVAALTGDSSYVKAINAIWDNVVSKKLHLNGGIGARRHIVYSKGLGGAHEAFGEDYDLPNEDAYLETCAAIANALWNQRMFMTYGDAKYIDVLERTIYNGFLSGVSLTGKEFFYPNPLASKGGYKRSKWFGCSCCPVNIVRFIPQVAQFAYATKDNDVYINLFIENKTKLKLKDGVVKLSETTDYPWNGAVKINVEEICPNDSKLSTLNFKLNVRIPGWCVGRPVPSDLYTQVTPGSLSDFKIKVNGKAIEVKPIKGYCVIDREWKRGDTVEVSMNMPVRRVKSHANVAANKDRLAVERGPIVYCAEGVDNNGFAFNACVPENAKFADDKVVVGDKEFPALKTNDGVILIPYCIWGNRKPGNEMQVWFNTKPVETTVTVTHDGVLR